MLSFDELCILRELVEIQLEKEFEMEKRFMGKKTRKTFQECFNCFFELYVKLSKEMDVKTKEKYIEMHREINSREAE